MRLTCFKLIDLANSQVVLVLDTVAASLDSESSYEICSRQNEPGKLFVIPKNEESSTIVHATLLFCQPVLRISACRSGVFVVPGYLDSISPKIGSQAWQFMKLEPSSDEYPNSTLLRPDDIIRIGTNRLRVEAEFTENDVQVGSSIPTAAEDNVDAAEPQITVHGLPTSVIEVDRSLRAQDSFAEITQSPKPIPVVAETPASRRKQLDFDAKDPAQDGSSQLPESVQERLQFAVDSTDDSPSDTPALGAEESQELLGCNLVERAGMVARKDADDESVFQQTKEDSTESQEPFATAHSENMDPSLQSDEPDAAQAVDGAEDVGDSTADVISDTDSENEETIQPQPQSAVDVTTKDSTPPSTKKGKKRKSDSSDGGSTSKRRKSSPPEIDAEPGQDECIVVSQQSSHAAGSRATNGHRKPDTPPASSAKSAKSAFSAGAKAQRMIFSNSTVPQRSSIMKFLTKQGAKQVDNATAKGFDVLVVGTGELKRTSKLLTALALGKPVVTDDWILQSSKKGELLEVGEFSPKDATLEKEWGFTLEETTGRDRRNLFKGKSIFVTPALKRDYGSGFEDIVKLARLAGAKTVMSKPTRDAIQADAEAKAETIFIGLEKDDIDAKGLVEHGKVCYTKDFLSISILRGTLDLDDGKLKVAGHGPKAKTKTAKKVR